MVPQEEEVGGVTCGTQIDNHHTINLMVDDGFYIRTQKKKFTIRQVADEYTILNTGSVAFHADGDGPQSLFISDVVCSQVSSASHYRVTNGSYASSSAVRYAARILACNSIALL